MVDINQWPTPKIIALEVMPHQLQPRSSACMLGGLGSGWYLKSFGNRAEVATCLKPFLIYQKDITKLECMSIGL